MSSAKRDIQNQAPVELNLGNLLARKWGGFLSPTNEGKDSHKDLVIYRPVSVEVKCDYKAEETGNIYLETFNSYRKENSGLTATRADWWAHYIPSLSVAFVFRPKRMLSELRHQWGGNLVERCGDNNSDGYLLPLGDVRELPFVHSIQTPLF